MRKMIVLFLGILLLVMPVAAQDEAAPTIVDIVSENDNYSLLLEAVQSADPVVLETLSGAGTLTVFAPTNQAFRNLAAEFDADVNTLFADTELITALLLYHVVNERLTAADVLALDGELVNPLLPNSAFSVSVEGSVIRLNDIVRVVAPFDVQASNGIVHTVSDMIFPFSLQADLEALSDAPVATAAPETAPSVEPEATPEAIAPSNSDGITVTGTEDYPDTPETEIVTVATFPSQLTIAGRVVSDPRYSTLLTILTEVAPDYIDLLNGDGEFTLLAPNNTAFLNLLSTLDLDLESALEQPVLLRQILAYHVVEGAFLAEDIAALDGERVDTILDNGQFRESFRVEINNRGRVIINGIARVTSPDLGATNGVIHTVDNVILPQVALDTLEDLGIITDGELADS